MQLEEVATWRASPRTPAGARALVEDLLRRCALPSMIPTAALLTSELVTNAVVHVGGTITVRACCDNDHLVRVEVHDQSPVSPATGTKALEALGGRGLHLVDAMAEAWGSRTTGSGKVVWFELSRDGVVRRLPGV